LKTTAEKALPAAQAAAPAAVAPDPAPAAKPVASTPTPAPPPAPRERAKSGAANRPQPAPASPASTRLSGASAADAKLALTSFPGPSSHRFTDRFAPAPMAAARAMTEISDSPKPVTKVDPKLANAWKTKPGRELSEPELLAMPEAEYMNDKQLDIFRKRLHQQRDDLLSNAGETTEHLREDTSIVPDPADRATIEEEHALELRTRDRERKLLKKISQSIARLDSGEYGYCDETGEPIGLPRLLARPTATLSLEAQQRRELKQKMFGD
jgi:DnaK suppressor protein